MGGRAIAPAAALVIALAAACSTFSGSDPVPATGDDAAVAEGGAVDAGADTSAPSAWVPCAMVKPSPFFCADFDESPQTIYQNGLPTQPPPMDLNATITYRAPATSTPSALWIDSMGGDWAIVTDGTSVVDRLEASFDVRFDAFSANPLFALAVIGARAPAIDHCYAALQFESMRLIVQSHCGTKSDGDGGVVDVNKYKDVTSGLPSTMRWFHVELVMDLPEQKVTVQFGGAPAVELDLGVPIDFGDVTAGGKPHFAIGVSDNAGTNTIVGLDDIVVR